MGLMRTQSMDTSEAVERVMIHGHRRFSAIQRFNRVRSLTGSISAMRSTGTLSQGEALRQQYGMIVIGAAAVREAPPFDIHSTLLTVTQLAESLGHVAVLTGGIACCLYGFPRTVRDIDVLMTPASAEEIFEHLATSWLPLSSSHACRSLIDPSTLIKVDLMTTQGRIALDPLLARRQSIPFSDAGDTVSMLSAEDVLLTRLAWYQDQDTSPDDQWNDLMGIVKIHAPLLDRLYVRAQAHVYHLDSLLDQLLEECDEGDLMHESDGYTDHHSAFGTRAGSL
jgi:hypothetical protein